MNEQKRNDIGQAIKQHAQKALSLSLSLGVFNVYKIDYIAISSYALV